MATKSNAERAREMLDREANRILKSVAPTQERAEHFETAASEVSMPDVAEYLAKRAETAKKRVKAKNVLATIIASVDPETIADALAE